MRAPILGVIGLIAGAFLFISETSNYLFAVSPLHNVVDDALFGRAFLTPVRRTPIAHCKSARASLHQDIGYLGISISDAS